MNDLVEPKMIDVVQDILTVVSGGTAGGTTTLPATQITQEALLNELQLKSDGTSTEPMFTTCTTQVQTPTMVRTATSATIPANAIHISITNVGIANGIVLGAVLKSKETVHFTVTDRDAKLSAVSFNATGTEFVITTLQGA